MRVKIAPGTWREYECELVDVLRVDGYGVDSNTSAADVYDYTYKVAEQCAQLTALLVERGVLTLADCATYLGAPHMEKA